MTGGHLAEAAAAPAPHPARHSPPCAGLVSHVVPSHTREAFFQLFCDLRANTPKDRRFLVLHARAFAPQTTLGWLVRIPPAPSCLAVGPNQLICWWIVERPPP